MYAGLVHDDVTSLCAPCRRIGGEEI